MTDEEPLPTDESPRADELAIDAYREAHPELLALARLYDRLEVRQTVTDIEGVADPVYRQSLLKSLFLGLAGDPGSCQRIGYLYLVARSAVSLGKEDPNQLGHHRDWRQIGFWLERRDSFMGGWECVQGNEEKESVDER